MLNHSPSQSPVKLFESSPTGVGTITFNLPAGYSHIRILINIRSTNASVLDNLLAQFNADAGNNYDRIVLSGSGFGTTTTVAAAQSSGIVVSSPANNATANKSACVDFTIFDYRNTTFHKSALANTTIIELTTANDVYIQLRGIGWRNTAAITSITLALAAGNFAAGTKFTIYGIP